MGATVGLWEHFRRLFDYKGREDRASFWPFAAVAFIVITIAGMFFFVPMVIRTMAAMQEYAAQHPEQATITSGPGQYSVRVQGHHPEFWDAGSMALYLGVTFGLAILLYSAAVARRLHDRGKSGWWGLMPVPFITYSSIAMPTVFASAREPNMAVFFSVFLSNMVYIVTLVWLIVLLAGPSDTVPNRYDPSA